MLPNHKNIINVAPPNERFFNKIQNFIFEITHKQNSVLRWCKFSHYGRSLNLLKNISCYAQKHCFSKHTLPKELNCPSKWFGLLAYQVSPYSLQPLFVQNIWVKSYYINSTENKIIWQISKFIKFFQEIACVLYK